MSWILRLEQKHPGKICPILDALKLFQIIMSAALALVHS